MSIVWKRRRFGIKNREGLRLAVVVEQQSAPKGLAFVMHGLGGFKEQPHIRAMIGAFHDNGFDVVSFDAANTIGESGGRFENASVTNYLTDLEDVIAWAAMQPYYREPFALAGHSLGGLCTALYAEQHPERVRLLAPISTVVSGVLSLEAHGPAELQRWKETGWREEESRSKPGVMKRLPWSHMEDRLRYDLLPGAGKLTMPVLLMVGSEDDGTPPEQQQTFHDVLPGPKQLHVIEGAPHTFRDPAHNQEIREVMGGWIREYVGARG